MGADIFEAWFHGCEDDAFVAEAFFVYELHEGRYARLVVAVDACCPFEFDEWEDIVLGADVEILGEGADGACVGDASASLGEGFGLELG